MDRRPRLATYLAGAIIVVVVAGFAITSAFRFLSASVGFVHGVYGVLALSALLAIQLLWFSRPSAPLDSRTSRALLAAMVVLVYLPLPTFGMLWADMPAFVGGASLLVLRPRYAWAGLAAAPGSEIAIYQVFGASILDTVYNGLGALFYSLVFYFLARLARMVHELHQARTELARRAVAEQRPAYARDLHELLSLDGESGTARSILAAADVRVRLEMLQDELPEPVRTVLAVVLREGITNVLRHSKVEACEITMRRTAEGVSLEILNDGVEPAKAAERSAASSSEPPAPAHHGNGSRRREASRGSGIGNLSYRVADLGGKLDASVQPDGRYRLRAVVPVQAGPSRPDGSRAAGPPAPASQHDVS